MSRAHPVSKKKEGTEGTYALLIESQCMADSYELSSWLEISMLAVSESNCAAISVLNLDLGFET